MSSTGILGIIDKYQDAFELLDAYDREAVPRPTGTPSTYVLGYEECMGLVAQMQDHFGTDLFGREKDESFRSSTAAIYQSFAGQDIYPSVQEKAANLLYLVIKNHSFFDGNKRIGCALFLYFLDRNGLLTDERTTRLPSGMLVAMALMIAESRPEEKDTMISLVMNFLR